jgi:CheY-like chemotaxis protein
VLLVDDQEVVRSVMCQAMLEAGFRVLVADDGQTAWGILEQAIERIHLIVTDIVMPVMGGVELARRVATLPSPPLLIFVSGYGRGVVSPERPFLMKPFEPDQLVALANRMLGEAASSPAAPQSD